MLFGKTSPTISWNANIESDLAGYRIYYGSSSGVYTSNVAVSNVTTSRVMSGITPIQKWYYFAVTAYDAAGNESSFSSEVRYYISDPSTREVILEIVGRKG